MTLAINLIVLLFLGLIGFGIHCWNPNWGLAYIVFLAVVCVVLFAAWFRRQWD